MTRLALAVAGLGLAASLSACGGGDSGFTDQSAEEIVEASKTAMGELEAVKVSGVVTSDGEEISIDVQTNSDGDCVGSVGVGGGSAEIVGTDGSSWFRPDDAFWKATAGEAAPQVMAVVGDKWVVVPAGDEGFGQFCDLDQLLDQLLEDSDADEDATYTKGDTEDVDGSEAIAVDREDPEDGGSTGYVLVDDPHYIVKIERIEGEDAGTVTFSEFDEEFEAEAPAKDETIDLDQMTG